MTFRLWRCLYFERSGICSIFQECCVLSVIIFFQINFKCIYLWGCNLGYGGFFSFWVLLWRKEEESGVDGRKLYFKEMLQAGSDFFPPAQAGSNWGDWGSASFCPEGSWATGFQLKVHLQQQHPRHCHKKYNLSFSLQVEPDCGAFCDDTALNGV